MANKKKMNNNQPEKIAPVEEAGSVNEVEKDTPAAEDNMLSEAGRKKAENDTPAAEDYVPAEAGQEEKIGWVEELKESLDNFADDLKKMTGKSASVDGQDAPEDQGPPPPSKDELSNMLESVKAAFTHTPLEITPDLEKLLADELKEEKKNTKRSAQMIGVLAKHNFYANGLTPEELRTTLEDLGPTYVKIGQIMSSRVDLLPENYCRELEKLRQNVRELDPAVARAVIEAETGRKIDEIYSEFRDKPIGSASIGQVHFGVLRDGTKVVTKVQRPLIAEMMQKDFDLLKGLGGLLGGGDKSDSGGDTMDLVTIIEEFEKVTEEELDFRIEAANTKFFRDVILTEGTVTCPRVIDELTTERIFTMTYVDGCSVSKKDELPANGIDPVQCGRDILESYVHQVFDAGIFHADPHQGNIMVSDGRVHWIDFGMIGQITEADMNALQDLVIGLLKGDIDAMADGVLAIGKSSSGTDRNKLKEDLERLSAKYMNVSSLSDIDFSALLGEVCDLADKHHIEMPGRYTMLVRSFLTIEGVMEQLCPELNLFDVISDKLMERMKKSFSLEQEVLSLGRGVLDVGQKVSKIPQSLADALNDIVKGRLKINLELTGYEELISRLNEKIDDLILVIVACVLFSGGCKLCQTDIKPMTPSGMPLFAVIILVISISLLIYALKRIFKKK